MIGFGPHDRLRSLTRRLLRAARRGEISYGELFELLRAHLECPEFCRESEVERLKDIPLSAYRDPVQRLRRGARLARAERDAQEKSRAVPILLDTLRELSVEHRLLRVRNLPERYANRMLCEEILDQARACLPDDPPGSLAWAQTAEAVAELYSDLHSSHMVRALAFQGNAYRAASDFVAARTLLQRAWNLLEEHEVIDLEVEAEVHGFLGSLFSDFRHSDEAAEHLDRALHLYKLLELDEPVARVLMKQALLHRHLADLGAAMEADRAALDLLSPHTTPRHYLAARMNYACHLTDARQHEAARDVLAYDEDLYADHAGRHVRKRLRWLEGRIAASIGDARLAESTFLAVRQECLTEGHPYDAAIACLDLATLYQGQGRHSDSRRSALQARDLAPVEALRREAAAFLQR